MQKFRQICFRVVVMQQRVCEKVVLSCVNGNIFPSKAHCVKSIITKFVLAVKVLLNAAFQTKKFAMKIHRIC